MISSAWEPATMSSPHVFVTGQLILITDKFSLPSRPHGESYLPSGSIGIPSGKKLLWRLPSFLSGKLPVERSSV